MNTILKNIIPKLLIMLVLSSCAAVEEGRIKPPLVYRINIQQGNVIDQKMINKLKVGMDEKQVRFIMGTPLLQDPFHPERWDYLYYFQESDNTPEQRHITLIFEDGKLSHLRGDITVTHIPIEEDPARTEKSVVVPDGYRDEGLFDSWFDRKPQLAKPRDEAVEETELDSAAEQAIEQYEESVEQSEALSGTEENNEDLELEAAAKEIAEESEAEVTVTEESEEEEPGFFSRVWDKLSGDEE